MKRHLVLAILAALVALPSFPAWASDGEIFMGADVGRGNSQKACPYWNMRWKDGNPNQNSPFGVCGVPQIKVYGQLQGASAGGITGVEFAGKIGPTTAADPGFILLEVPNPTATTMLGSAFMPPDPVAGTGRGMSLAWADCQTGTGGFVLLSTLIVIPLSACGPGVAPGQFNLSAGQHGSPNNDFFRCPLFTLCDAPAFTKVCLGTNLTLCSAFIIPRCDLPGQPRCPQVATCSTSGSFAFNDPTNPTDLLGCVNIKKATLAQGAIEAETWGNVKALYR